jgi:hypothetical protein
MLRNYTVQRGELDGEHMGFVGDGLVVPSWLALCWVAQGSGFESQRGHLYHHGGRITGGFCPGADFPSCHKSSVRIISEAPLVCPNGF